MSLPQLRPALQQLYDSTDSYLLKLILGNSAYAIDTSAKKIEAKRAYRQGLIHANTPIIIG